MARSKEFEIDDVLDKAMNLFWYQGYEKTSMQDLVAGMGIHKRSMYDTFGDKHTLYIKAVKRYEQSISDKMQKRFQGESSVRPAIRSLYEMVLDRTDEKPRGCLMVNTAVELSLHDSEVDGIVNQSFLNSQQMIEELILKGQASGEISGKHQASALAVYLHNALVGLRVMVKTEQDPAKLKQIVDITLSALD